MIGKTETIKERAFYAYLPSIDYADRWKKLANKHGSPISRFVVEHGESSLRQEENGFYESGAQLKKQIEEPQEELFDLREIRRILRRRSNLLAFFRYIQRKGGDLSSLRIKELKGSLSPIQGEAFA
ncbi:MAG: hypothetical protein ACE5KV_08170 [Thermoplasmata archaeon]